MLKYYLFCLLERTFLPSVMKAFETNGKLPIAFAVAQGEARYWFLCK